MPPALSGLGRLVCLRVDVAVAKHRARGVMMVPHIPAACITLLGGAMAVAAWDLAARRVPNQLLIVLFALQCLLLAAGRSHVGWGGSTLGFAVGLFGLLPFYALRWMGAGDVKFAGVLGFMVGPIPLLLGWVVAGLCAGAHALAVMTYRTHPLGAAVVARVAQWSAPQQGEPKRSPLWLRPLQWVVSLWQRARAKVLIWRGVRHGIPYAAYLAFGVCWIVGDRLFV